MTLGTAESGGSNDVSRARFPAPLYFVFCCLVHSQEGDSRDFTLPGSSSTTKKEQLFAQAKF